HYLEHEIQPPTLMPKVIFITFLALIAPTALIAKTPKPTAMSGREFISNFYRKYIDDLSSKNPPTALENPIFSKSFIALMKENLKTCKTLSRGDEICGFGANGDVFMNSQDWSDELKFDTALFEATEIKRNIVDISFATFPEESSLTKRILRYELVQEGGTWKVNDIKIQDKDKTWSDGARADMRRETESVKKNAKNFEAIWSWVSTFSCNDDFSDRLPRFFKYPVQLCDESGKCQNLKKHAAPLTAAISKILSECEASKAKEEEPEPKTPAKGMKSMKTRTVGAYTFELDASAWWIRKIDLGSLKGTF
ncbi:MAG: DUF3828 domain-containing protein, partial [Proteobacteria bacterium]|nr:DUF3828 domain-containing protein [Pseudomonadota bacterium]